MLLHIASSSHVLFAIRDLIKGLDSKDMRKLLTLLMHHLQPIWKGLKGIRYPKTKEEIIQIVSQKTSTLSREVLNLISSLPKRSYRDSAEVAKALGEINSGKRPRSSLSIAKSEPPS